MTRFDVTSVGEAMIRLSVYSGTRLVDADRLTVHTGGAESNVLSGLSQLGHRCAWIGGLPENHLGHRVARDLSRVGIDVSGAYHCTASRMGVYYVEHAGEPLVTSVLYDRADSCASSLRPDLVNWETLLDTQIVHLTGITPALSVSALATIEQTFRRSRDAGVKLSFDVNFRSKLWSSDEASAVLRPLIEEVDVLICSHRDAVLLFGCDADPYEALSQLGDLTTASCCVLTRGNQGAMAHDRSTLYEEAALPGVVLDRMGAGDAFAAGLLHGILLGDIRGGLRFGATMGSLALGQFGDMVTTNLDEVTALSDPVESPMDVDR